MSTDEEPGTDKRLSTNWGLGIDEGPTYMIETFQ